MLLHLRVPCCAGAAAVLQLGPAAMVPHAQSFQADRPSGAGYEANTNYGRLTDTTRTAVPLKGSSCPFGLGSQVWLEVSFTHPGRSLTTVPDTVLFILASFPPACGGWAFARPGLLRMRSSEGMELEFPAAEYERLRTGLFDAGRRELLSFEIPTRQFVVMSAEPELELKAGGAKLRLRQTQRDLLQEGARRLTPTRARLS